MALNVIKPIFGQKIDTSIMLIVEENSPTILAASVIKKNGQKFNH
jgi:hypothetical protein